MISQWEFRVRAGKLLETRELKWPSRDELQLFNMTDSEGGAIFLDQSQSAKKTNPGGGLRQSIDFFISFWVW